MKLIKAKFRNLAGVYAGTGLKEIEIDFTKCKHDIIYIIGKNGSGKSTLMSALHPLPDPSSMYIEGESGSKVLEYFDNGKKYKVEIQYPINPSNKSRATTKAFIEETDLNGLTTQLNSAGTVGSFKDIIYSKFSLDPNFAALSFLSVEDRGMVDKRPGERKKFVSSLLESVEVYNDIYKTLSKRANVFKSMVNNITAKIDSIGDYQKLLFEKNAAEKRFNELNQKKSNALSAIAAAEATIKIIDPEDRIQLRYKELFDELTLVKNEISMIETSVNFDGIDSINQATTKYNEVNEKLNSVKAEIEADLKILSSISSQRSQLSTEMYQKSTKLDSLLMSMDSSDMEKAISDYRKKITEYQEVFRKINIDGDSITKDEYVTGLSTLEDLRDAVLNIKLYATQQAIEMACDRIAANGSFKEDILKWNSTLTEAIVKRESTRDEIAISKAAQEKMKILEQRPEDCSINTCPFIADALLARDSKPEARINWLNFKLDEIDNTYNDATIQLEKLELASKVYDDLNRVIRMMTRNSGILSKLPVQYTVQEFIDKVKRGDTFNDIYNFYQYIEYANIFELYKNDSKILQQLQAEYNLLQERQSTITELTKDIESIQSRISELDEQIQSSELARRNNNAYIGILQADLEKINTLISKYRKLDQLKVRKDELESQIKVVSENIEKISAQINIINFNNNILANVNMELEPLSKAKDSFNYSLNKLTEYQQELNEYNEKYKVVEVLRNYSSPTKGIQTIFMELYMNKTLELSNKILSMMFGGELELCPYIINEAEFRIPVKNNATNIIVEDISMCSTSQKCMIALIMGFVLAFHGSSIYNIIRLDEIDGGLDSANRGVFPETLRHIMHILNISQCFIVSHASEAVMTDVDIICLEPVVPESLPGNVIFSAI